MATIRQFQAKLMNPLVRRTVLNMFPLAMTSSVNQFHSRIVSKSDSGKNQLFSNVNNTQAPSKWLVRFAHKPALTYDYIRERILLVLRLYDKIDPDRLTLDSHFYNDLGLDSLDHVELIMAIEDEFQFEIPDQDAEKLNTPHDILKYISIKEEIYPELEHRDSHHEGHH